MVLGAFNHQKAIIIGEYNKGNITKENADKALATIEKTKLKTLEMIKYFSEKKYFDKNSILIKFSNILYL